MIKNEATSLTNEDKLDFKISSKPKKAQSDQYLYIQMEYCPNKTLRDASIKNNLS